MIVLVGIDGVVKTTAARALSQLLKPSTPTLILANYSGRRTMTAWAERFNITLPTGMLDFAESVISSANVIPNQCRSRSFEGVIIMDRHLRCQQALLPVAGTGQLRDKRMPLQQSKAVPARAVGFEGYTCRQRCLLPADEFEGRLRQAGAVALRILPSESENTAILTEIHMKWCKKTGS